MNSIHSFTHLLNTYCVPVMGDVKGIIYNCFIHTKVEVTGGVSEVSKYHSQEIETEQDTKNILQFQVRMVTAEW